MSISSISPVSSSPISIPQSAGTPPSQGGQTPQSDDVSGAQVLSSGQSHGHHHRGGGARKVSAATTPSDPKAPGTNLNVTT